MTMQINRRLSFGIDNIGRRVSGINGGIFECIVGVGGHWKVFWFLKDKDSKDLYNGKL